MKRTLILLAAVAMFAWTAMPAVCAVEDFEDGVADYGWSFGFADVVQSTGGNPGYWLNNPSLDTFAPILSTEEGAADFTGDYRAMGVTAISFDARTDYIDFGPVPIEMSVLLRDTKGTPSVDDDDYAYFPGAIIPQPGEGWLHYEFIIPSASTEAVPAGWSGGWVGDGENFRPGIDWNDVITGVDVVEIWWFHPAYFGIFQNWNVGVDNITITVDPGCAVEDFEDGVADYGLSFGFADVVQSTGGNPGYWLNNPSLDTFAPILSTDEGAADFTGDYRGMGVTTITFDARTDHMDFGYNPIEMSVLLRDTKGTPTVDDDDYAYFPGQLIPEIGVGWVHYEFTIPSASLDAVPAGWSGGWVGDGENFRPGVEWSDVITSVDVLEIWWFHPAYFGIFQNWNVGVDNLAICYGGPDFGAALDVTPETGTLPFPLTVVPQVCNFDSVHHQYYGQIDFTRANGVVVNDWRHGTVTVPPGDCKLPSFQFNLPAYDALRGNNTLTLTFENLDTGVVQSATAVVNAN